MKRELDLAALSQRNKKLTEAEMARLTGMYDLCDGKDLGTVKIYLLR